MSNRSPHLTPDELQAHVKSLLSEDHPVFGSKGTIDLKNLGNGRSSLGEHLTEYRLRRRTSNGKIPREKGNVLKNYKHSEVASGDCHIISSFLLPHMPPGTQLRRLVSVTAGYGSSDHWVHEVPTTEGPHIVDFTHRQFGGRDMPTPVRKIPFPLIEPKETFAKRETLKHGFMNVPEGDNITFINRRKP